MHLQGSCTLAGAETTRFVFTVPKLYRLNLYLELQHVSQYGSLQCKVPRDRAVCVLGFYQVVTDMRLWLRDAISTLADDAVQLLSTMVERAAV